MTKRACPFDLTFYRQLKVHVGDYDNDNAMEEIHEKTMKKLFSGSKYLSPSPSKRGINANDLKEDGERKPDWDVVEAFECDNEYKQKQITSYFTCDKRQKPGRNEILKGIKVIKLECCYCGEKTDSAHECIKCQENFCESCSFFCYESAEDVWICLSCS